MSTLRVSWRHHDNIKSSVITQGFVHGADYAAPVYAAYAFRGLLGGTEAANTAATVRLRNETAPNSRADPPPAALPSFPVLTRIAARMRYWWVNQNQTYRHEVLGGYLWSPKRNRDGRVNPFYEFMKEVAPGDLVFSFADTHIPAVGRALSIAYEAPKPLEFGQVGAYWELIGWRIDVDFVELANRIRPVEHIDRLRPFLPERYAPLQANGNGLQSVYLTHLSAGLASQLIDLIGTEARGVIQGWKVSDVAAGRVLVGQAQWEEHQLAELRASALSETSKQSLVFARRGQGLFRTRVAAIERRCRVTGIDNLEYLRASHTKPWRDASNEERLDGENGLLLSPDVDLLFDRGLISFEDSGKVILSPVADTRSIELLGLKEALSHSVGTFSAGQRAYLQYHRENIFLEARVSKL